MNEKRQRADTFARQLALLPGKHFTKGREYWAFAGEGAWFSVEVRSDEDRVDALAFAMEHGYVEWMREKPRS